MSDAEVAPAIGSTAWLVACEEIRQLASRYALALSHRRYDELVALFVPDVQVGREARGRAALRANFEQQLTEFGRIILHVTNQVIDLTGPDEATGVVSTRGELEIGGEWVIQVIEYRDTYRRVDGRWLFVRRDHRLWYGAPIGTNPIGLPPANWPERHVGTGDLPEP